MITRNILGRFCLLAALLLNSLGKDAAKSYYMVGYNNTDITHFSVDGATAVAGMIAASMKAQGIWPQPEEQ